MGALRDATDKRIAELDDPDVALVALAQNLADKLDGDYGNASHAKVYHGVMRDLCAAGRKGPSLDDLEDD